MKIVGLFTKDTESSYQWLKNYLSLCVEGIPVDVEYRLSEDKQKSEIEEIFGVDEYPAFVLLTDDRQVCDRFIDPETCDLRALAILSCKKLKI